MQSNVYLLTIAFIIFGSKFDVAVTKAMLGENVRQARPEEFPYVVSIKRINPSNPEPEQDHVCSGVLVSNRDVITMEYCIQYLQLNNTEVLIGSNDIREGTPHYVSWWITYNEWSLMQRRDRRFTENEILMLRLNDTVSSDITPVTISYLSGVGLQQVQIKVAGFGKDESGETNRILQTASLKIISKRECQQKILNLQQYRFPITDRYLCGIGVTPVLLTHGESGSPVLVHGQLVGIHLGTFPIHLVGFDPRKINMFLSIDFYRDYIHQVIRYS